MRDKKFLIAVIAIAACGLIAAGCGGDDSSTTADDVTTGLEDLTAPGDVSVPQDAQDAIDQAQKELEDADVPGSIEEAVQQCIDNVDSSGLPDDQKQSLKDLCEAGQDAANNALEDLPGN